MAILDSISAVPLAAYALRKLRAGYSGNAFRARRSSDGTEQDIGFDGAGNLDIAALLAFVGSGNGFVKTWYDQTGNGRHLSHSNIGSLPRIVNAGVLHLENNKPAIDFSLNTTTALFTDANIPVTTPKIFSVVHQTTATGLAFLFDFNGIYFTAHFYQGNCRIFNGNNVDISIGALAQLMQLVVSFDAGNDAVYRDGVLYAGGNAGDTARNLQYVLGNSSQQGAQFNGLIGENILFDGAISASDITTLSNDQRVYFGLLSAAPTITTSSPLPNATAGAAYSQQLAATGVSSSFTWTGGTGLPGGLNLSAAGLISGSAAASGNFNFTATATDPQNGQSSSKTFALTVTEPAALPYGFTQKGVELFFEANLLSQSNNSNLSAGTDQSAKARQLTATAPTPTFVAGVYNGKATARFSGAQNPLKNAGVFTMRCAWILAKYDAALFPDGASGAKGLLTDLLNTGILVGNASSNVFFNFGYDLYEFRSNDLIKPSLGAPAPMNALKLHFVRFWTDIQMNGVSIGQDRADTTRKWSGDIPLVILTSRDYCEADVRARSQAIAAAYGITLADVLPYPSDDDVPVSSADNVSYYDPPEGARVSEVTGDGGKIFDLQFTSRRRQEKAAIELYHETHYTLSLPCVHRSFQQIPPKDFVGYIDSPLKMNGKNGDYNYSFRFLEKKTLI